MSMEMSSVEKNFLEHSSMLRQRIAELSSMDNEVNAKLLHLSDYYANDFIFLQNFFFLFFFYNVISYHISARIYS